MKKLKKNFIVFRILLTFAIFVIGIIIQKTIEIPNQYIWLAIFLPAYLFAGYDVLFTAIKNIFNGKLLDENFLMTIASAGAFVIGAYPEALAVMVFYQIGEWFQNRALGKSRKSISDLMDIRPDKANLLKDGKVEIVDPFDVQVGDIIHIKPSERVPLDCRILNGNSSVDTKQLTGESLPREVESGDEILSGFINLNGVLEAQVTKEFSESTASKILDMVENAGNNKSRSEKFISKFATIYTPIVVLSALILAIVPSIITGDWKTWIYRALSFLVVSCPCALVLSVPLTYFAGIGLASKHGILIKGSNFLEALNKIENIVFDKTGTLTKGNFEVCNVVAYENNKDFVDYAIELEKNSSHPISKSICKLKNKNDINFEVESVDEIAGQGILGFVNGKYVVVGNAKLMEKSYIELPTIDNQNAIIFVAVDGILEGYFEIADEIKPDAKIAVESLKNSGVKKIAMLSGDKEKVAEKIALQLNLDDYKAELLPQDKVEAFEKLAVEKKNAKSVFVGDGMNDAPVLARADIGVAMGCIGSDAAIEAADIVLMTDEPSKLVIAKKIAKKTMRIVYENIYFSIFIKILAMVLIACGVATIWFAIFADVGVLILAILNSIRALIFKERKHSCC